MEKANQNAAGVVLVVDDNAAMLMTMKKMLLGDGYQVLSASHGAAALALAQQHVPHLVLLDVMMPDMSGYDVCKQLKGNPVTQNIPVVFVSGLTKAAEQVEGLKLGALDYITKPIDKNIMLTKTRSFVQLSLSHQQNIEMHRNQQKINQELEQFSQALDNASDGVVFTDTDGHVTFVNIAFGHLIQRSFAELEGLSIASLFPADTPIESAIHGALGGSSVTLETTLLKENAATPVQLRCSAIMNELVQPTGLLMLVSDLSEQKRAELERDRLELELFHSQKLESVGQLAAGIAHEINTPIQFIGDNLRFLHDTIQDLFALNKEQQKLLEAAKASGFDPPLVAVVEKAAKHADLGYLREEIPKAIDQSLDGVKRVASIVLAMKEFAHPGSSEMNPANLNEAIITTVTVARNKWKYVAELETDFDETLPMIPCLVGELNQVVLNLIINACDAIFDVVDNDGGLGKIRITTRKVGPFAEIRISDTGGGIPAEIQGRIFEPFFTTKEVGRGSGQGLPIAHGVVVNKHHGELCFETEAGKGTTFIVRLPLMQENHAAGSPQ